MPHCSLHYICKMCLSVAQETIWAWRMVFYISAGIYAFSIVFYEVFGSGELQHWSAAHFHFPKFERHVNTTYGTEQADKEQWTETNCYIFLYKTVTLAAVIKTYASICKPSLFRRGSRSVIDGRGTSEEDHSRSQNSTQTGDGYIENSVPEMQTKRISNVEIRLRGFWRLIALVVVENISFNGLTFVTVNLQRY